MGFALRSRRNTVSNPQNTRAPLPAVRHELFPQIRNRRFRLAQRFAHRAIFLPSDYEFIFLPRCNA